MHRTCATILACVVVGVLAAACSPSSSSSQAPGTVPAVLDFEAPLLDGGTLRGADLTGKDVAFWFWAPW
jgi:hypothetical protein